MVSKDCGDLCEANNHQNNSIKKNLNITKIIKKNKKHVFKKKTCSLRYLMIMIAV